MTASWKETHLPTILSRYELKDIFNAAEFGLFYQALRSKSMHFKNERCSGGKFSKVRLTGLAAANATGEKLPMFVIGNQQNLDVSKTSKICHVAIVLRIRVGWMATFSQNGSGNPTTNLLLKAERLHSSLIAAPLTLELIICKQ